MKAILRTIILVFVVVLIFRSCSWVRDSVNGAISTINNASKTSVTYAGTPVIQNIRDLNQFITASYYDEIVKVSTKKNLFFDDRIVRLYNVTIEAGFDLSNLDENRVQVVGDTAIYLRLPKPEVLYRICNPADKQSFSVSGDWSDAEIIAIDRQVKDSIELNARNSGILRDASRNGIDQLTQLLSTFGFSREHVHVEQE